MIRDFTASTLATLLVTLDPPGLAPIFIGLGGGVILRLLGIGLPAFRIAGGMLLFWIAFEMVFQARGERKAHAAQTAVSLDRIRNVAAFPLAMPLLAGPGAIT